jgi:hypothetical protein
MDCLGHRQERRMRSHPHKFLQSHGAVPALRGPAMPNLPRSQSCRCHITSHPEGKKCRLLPYCTATKGSCSRTKPCETQSAFDVWLPTYERDRDAFVSVVQFIYLTPLFSHPIASFSPIIVRCSSRHFSVSADLILRWTFVRRQRRESIERIERIELFGWLILSVIAPPFVTGERKVPSRPPIRIDSTSNKSAIAFLCLVLGPNPIQP